MNVALGGDYLEDYSLYTSSSVNYGFVQIEGKLGCLLTMFRSVLNEYSTGLCILASAFMRYCLICHPNRQILTPQFLRILSCSLVMLILIPIGLNVWSMSVHFWMADQVKDQTKSTFERFLRNCSNFTIRTNAEHFRLLWDILACLGVPASLSAFFYFKICQVLMNRDRNENRNRNLTLVFFFNWLVWVLSWSLYFLVMSLELSLGDNGTKLVSERTFMDTLKERSRIVKENICFLYSHVNPLAFLIILKPFQANVKQQVIQIFKSHDDGFGLSDETVNQQKAVNKAPTSNLKPEIRDGKALRKKKLRQYISCIALIFLGSAVLLIFIRGVN